MLGSGMHQREPCEMTTKQWLHGLIAAFIGGSATFITTGPILSFMAPATFNFGPELSITIKTTLALSLWGGIQTMAAFLKDKPLPEWKGDDRRSPPEPSVKVETKTETDDKTVTDSVTVKNPQMMG